MRLIAIALVCTCAGVSAGQSVKRMADGKQWTTENSNVDVQGSYCYDDAAHNCQRYGRLYTWAAAPLACRALGAGWRLPSNDEWHQLGHAYGGIRTEAKDDGRAAYAALMMGGSSGFNAVLSGGRAGNGEYARLDAHGLYWTASASSPEHAWVYNFGKGSGMFGRHRDLDKEWAFAVRCVNDDRP